MEAECPRHFEILFEDDHLMAVNKPSGLPTIPGGGFMENTLLRLVQEQIPTANPVHRLGRGTSGIVLFAKTPQAAAKLSANWNTPKIQKIYAGVRLGGAGKKLVGRYRCDALVPVVIKIPFRRVDAEVQGVFGGLPRQLSGLVRQNVIVLPIQQWWGKCKGKAYELY